MCGCAAGHGTGAAVSQREKEGNMPAQFAYMTADRILQREDAAQVGEAEARPAEIRRSAIAAKEGQRELLKSGNPETEKERICMNSWGMHP